MFAFSAERLLEEPANHRADVLGASRAAWNRAKRELDFPRLDEQVLSARPAESSDYAVMELTEAAAVIPVDIGFSDVGSWSTLWEVAEKDEVATSRASTCTCRTLRTAMCAPKAAWSRCSA